MARAELSEHVEYRQASGQMSREITDTGREKIVVAAGMGSSRADCLMAESSVDTAEYFALVIEPDHALLGKPGSAHGAVNGQPLIARYLVQVESG